MPKLIGWKVYKFFTSSITATFYDSLQSHSVILPSILLVTTYLELNEGLAMPLFKVRIHLERPILHGSPDSKNSLPSGKYSISYAGGVIKLILIGFLIRTSC